MGPRFELGPSHFAPNLRSRKLLVQILLGIRMQLARSDARAVEGRRGAAETVDNGEAEQRVGLSVHGVLVFGTDQVCFPLLLLAVPGLVSSAWCECMGGGPRPSRSSRPLPLTLPPYSLVILGVQEQPTLVALLAELCRQLLGHLLVPKGHTS